MHSLETIHRLNAEAFAAEIDKARKAGSYVVAEYAGASLVTIHAFVDPQAAAAKFSELEALAHQSVHAVLLPPTAPARPVALRLVPGDVKPVEDGVLADGEGSEL